MSSKMNKLLNLITVAGIIILLATAIVAIRRVQSQQAYATLAERRDRQLSDDLSAELGSTNLEQPSPPSTKATVPFQAASEGSEIPQAKSVERFAYNENKNNAWLSLNPDFMGWLQIPGTGIDYPFVRGQDNTQYLKRDFSGKCSESGSLFMDYRNLGNFNDRHTLIYGHNMKNKSMFHNLIFYKDADFYEKNPLIYISGLYESKTYKIFSVYEVSADDYAFTLEFENDSAYLNYLRELEGISLHLNADDVNAKQKLLTLVTCGYGDNTRVIVHALELSSSNLNSAIPATTN